MTNCFHLLIIALTITNCICGSYATALEDKIANLLDKYRDTITGGEWLLPALDPLVWDHEKFHYINEKLHIDVETTVTARIIGFAKYRIESVKVDNQAFTIVFNLDETESHGVLEATGKIGDNLPVDGHGNFTGLCKNQLVTLTGKIGTNSAGFMELEDFSVLMHFEKMNIDITGFPGGAIYNRLISRLLTSALAQILNQEAKFFSDYTTPVFRNMFDPALNQFTFEQLMDLINNA